MLKTNDIVGWRQFLLARETTNRTASDAQSPDRFSLVVRPDEVRPDPRFVTQMDQDRMPRPSGPRTKQQFQAVRTALRMAIPVLLGRPCDPVEIHSMPGERPAVSPDVGVDLSLSYSGDHLALALSRQGPIGIDIETIRPIPEWPGLTRNWRAEDRQAVARAVNPARAFLRGWTAREAILKTFGHGLERLGDLDCVAIPAVGASGAPARLKTPLGNVFLTRYETETLTVAICHANIG